MAWGPLTAAVGLFNGAAKLLTLLADGSVLTARSSTTKFNVNATGQVKTGAGRLVSILVQTVPSGSALTFNDMVSSGTPAIGNQLHSIPYNAANMYAGAVINVDIPFTSGLNLSSIGTGGVYVLQYN